jgi:hypothetical protein
VVDNVVEVPGDDDDKRRPFIEGKLTLSAAFFSSDNSVSSWGRGIFLLARESFLSGVECDGGTAVCTLVVCCVWPDSVVVVASLPGSWASSFIHGESKQLTLRMI